MAAGAGRLVLTLVRIFPGEEKDKVQEQDSLLAPELKMFIVLLPTFLQLHWL